MVLTELVGSEVLEFKLKWTGYSPSPLAVERAACYLQRPGVKQDTRDSIYVPWQWSSLKTSPSSAFWLWLLNRLGEIAPSQDGNLCSTWKVRIKFHLWREEHGRSNPMGPPQEVLPPQSPPMEFPVGAGGTEAGRFPFLPLRFVKSPRAR